MVRRRGEPASIQRGFAPAVVGPPSLCEREPVVTDSSLGRVDLAARVCEAKDSANATPDVTRTSPQKFSET